VSENMLKKPLHAVPRQFIYRSVFHPALNDNDGSHKAEKILVRVLVDHLPLDGGSDRRVGLLHVQRERVGVSRVSRQRTREAAPMARVHIAGGPRDRNVEDDRVNLGLGALNWCRRWQDSKGNGGGNVGASNNSATHVRGVSAAGESDAVNTGQ